MRVSRNLFRHWLPGQRARSTEPRTTNVGASGTDPVLVSLGLSCVTQFIIQQRHFYPFRLPFDFNMTTKSALLRILSSEGAHLRLEEGNMRVFRLDERNTLGAHYNGIYFWHDYLRETRAIETVEAVITSELRERYERRWTRLLKILRAPDTIKHLVVADVQHGLDGMCGSPEQPSPFGAIEPFETMFEIDAAFVGQLSPLVLGQSFPGSRLHVLVRSIERFVTMTQQDYGPDVDVRFVGELGLPLDPSIGSNLAADILSSDGQRGRIGPIDGSYEGGIRIDAYRSDAAIIFADARPIGEVRAGAGCFTVVLAGSKNSRMLARTDGSNLHFSTGERWTRLKR
jgi:hypothetical protein